MRANIPIKLAEHPLTGEILMHVYGCSQTQTCCETMLAIFHTETSMQTHRYTHTHIQTHTYTEG